MRKLLILLVLLVLVACSNITSGGKKEYNFRDTYWGMSKEEVQNSVDGLELVVEEDRYNQNLVNLSKTDYLYYQGALDYGVDQGEDAIVSFYFDNDKLVSGSYGFDTNFNFLLSGEDIVNLVNGVKSELTEKYGDYEEKEYVDGLVITYTWQDNDTKITLELNTGIQPYVNLSYTSLDWLNSNEEDVEDL